MTSVHVQWQIVIWGHFPIIDDILSSAELHHSKNQNKHNPNWCHHPLITQHTLENSFSNNLSLFQPKNINEVTKKRCPLKKGITKMQNNIVKLTFSAQNLYFCFLINCVLLRREQIGWLTPSNVLPLFDITERKAIDCLVALCLADWNFLT